VIRSVGVIIPAHNEQDLLPTCLASVRRAAQALRGLPVHVVVVADACADLTAQAGRRGGASVVTISARSAGAARAAGALEVLLRTSIALTEFSNAVSKTRLPRLPSSKPSTHPLRFLPSRTTTTSMPVVPSGRRVKV